MSAYPTVSVIVPNYNYAKYLNARIESILNQSYQDFELILLDDASMDDSVKILEKYRLNPRISRIIVNTENTGSPFVQWMKGIKAAKGKWIWIAEADDLSSPDFLSVCVEHLNQYSDAIACCVGSYYIDADGCRIFKDANYWDTIKNYTEVKSRYFNGQFYASHKLYWSCCILNTSATVFLREAALKLSRSPFLSMKYSGDWMFWFQMAMLGGMIEIYENLNYFRQHDMKVTVSAKRMGAGLKEDIEIVHYMEQCLPCLTKYKRRLCHGLLWHRLRHLNLDDRIINELSFLMRVKLKSSPFDRYVLNLNRYIRYVNPWLLTFERDRKRNG